MRKTVIAGNWKMNKTKDDVLNFVEELKKIDLTNYEAEKMIFAPSYILETLVKETSDLDVIIGAQNMHHEEKGAYTGEISADMIQSIGVNTILIGHSERRQYFNETDKVVNTKLKLALSKRLQPVVCIGETLDERNENITEHVLKEQVTNAFKDIYAEEIANIIVAYEPVWAIGTGLTASAEDANSACKFVRGVLASLYSTEIAEQVVIQYGGSVSPANVTEILGQSDIDGALVGGASLEADSFAKLLK